MITNKDRWHRIDRLSLAGGRQSRPHNRRSYSKGFKNSRSAAPGHWGPRSGQSKSTAKHYQASRSGANPQTLILFLRAELARV